ncbi:Cdc6/Cdc18 family protein [Haloplanus salilacus]|uniref:Cdc6/Cdc18 family protein n=1 Tax=Haloplanus salilacus TaxID=2949994 RepID=UPI0030CF136F
MITDPEVFHETRLPRELLHRDSETSQLSRILKPAVSGHYPEDALITGPSGVGKTVLARFLLDNPQQPTAVATTHIRALGMTCGDLLREAINDHPSGTTVHRGTPTADLPQILQELVDDPYLLIIDEADDVPETDALDMLAGVPEVATIVIAHDADDWFARVDSRYRSRFDGDHHIRLTRYTATELADILEPRAEFGLESGAVSREQLVTIGNIVAGVARRGIQTLRWAAKIAENQDHDAITDRDITDGRARAQTEIRESNLRSLPYHHHVLYELIRAHDTLESSKLHDSYEAIQEHAYAKNRPQHPISRRARRTKLDKLREYDLIDWTEHEDNSRMYRVIDASIASEFDIPLTPLGR